MDINPVMEGGRPNIHAVAQLGHLEGNWLSISPQRDDLKLLCQQNVSRPRAARSLTKRCQHAAYCAVTFSLFAFFSATVHPIHFARGACCQGPEEGGEREVVWINQDGF